MVLRSAYKIFISHGFKENEDYKRLTMLLDDCGLLSYTCSSEPTSYKYRTMSKSQFEEQIRNQIKPANCFIALDETYWLSKEWVEYELKIAGKLGIPIIGLKKWKSKDISDTIESYSKIILGWNIDTIISTIKSYSI